jgi:alkylation response protein AidB-like acyl-CoA dehydrogenase
MGIAVTEDHLELGRVVRAFLNRHEAIRAARAALDGGSPLPSFWGGMAELGWLGLHVPEADGGSGFGLLELAVVAEELGRSCTPGPYVPTVIAAGLVANLAASPARDKLLARLLEGSAVAGAGFEGCLALDDAGRLDGDAGVVLWGGSADVLALCVGDDVVLVDRDAPGLSVVERPTLDSTQPCAVVTATSVSVPSDRIVRGAACNARLVFDVLVAAEAVGGVAGCRELAVEYANAREAFGRPIGSFQAIKHGCADMLVDESLAVAVVWDAASSPRSPTGAPLLARAAAALSCKAFVAAAKRTIQVHGGIGFTWEHDAHLYLRRSALLASLLGPVADAHADVARLSASGVPAVASSIELPPEAAQHCKAVRAFVAAYRELPEEERHEFLVDSGYLYPSWPKPWGRAAGALEQLAIKDELASIPRYAALGPTAWELPIILPTIIVHGTDDQRERWIRPTMLGEITWCQLFSEPGAGSDLASLSARAARVDGGWSVTGQKVWTSTAQHAMFGLALVRTNRDASRHRGITCMVVEMTAPGVTIRPLRQITGDTEFNEVLLDNVFVPDSAVVGDVDGGWRVARMALEFERGSSGSGEPKGDQLAATTVLLPSTWPVMQELWGAMRAEAVERDDRHALVEIGDLAGIDLGIRALRRRASERTVHGLERGAETSLMRLIMTTQVQRVAELAQARLGPEGVFLDGTYGEAELLLSTRMATIAGGTAEILRNVIAERILGLPRDPAPPA